MADVDHPKGAVDDPGPPVTSNLNVQSLVAETTEEAPHDDMPEAMAELLFPVGNKLQADSRRDMVGEALIRWLKR